MALIFDRVKESTTTTGTGDVTLGGAETGGFQAFGSVLTDGQSPYYTIQDTTNSAWEVGIGTYHAGTNTLSRTTVLASSNAGAGVNLAAGTKDVFIDYPAGRAVLSDRTNVFTASQEVEASDFLSGFPNTSSSGSAWMLQSTGGNISSLSASSFQSGPGFVPLFDICPDHTNYPTSGMRILNFPVFGTQDLFFQFYTNSSSFTLFEAVNTEGLYLSALGGMNVGTPSPIIFAPDRQEAARVHTNAFFGVGTTSPQSPIHAVLLDSATNTISVCGTLGHSSGQTPTAGFGVGLQFQADSSTTANRNAAEIDALWATATDGSRKGRITISAWDSTAAREGVRVESNGSVPMLGLFGATAVVQPATTGTTSGFTANSGTAMNSASTSTGGTGSSAYTFGDVILALKQLGALAA